MQRGPGRVGPAQEEQSSCGVRGLWDSCPASATGMKFLSLLCHYRMRSLCLKNSCPTSATGIWSPCHSDSCPPSATGIRSLCQRDSCPTSATQGLDPSATGMEFLSHLCHHKIRSLCPGIPLPPHPTPLPWGPRSCHPFPTFSFLPFVREAFRVQEMSL